MRPRLTAYP